MFDLNQTPVVMLKTFACIYVCTMVPLSVILAYRGWDLSYSRTNPRYFYTYRNVFSFLYWFCIIGSIPVCIYVLPAIDIFWPQIITDFHGHTVEIRYLGKVDAIFFEKQYLAHLIFVGAGLPAGICNVRSLRRVREKIQMVREFGRKQKRSLRR